MTSYERVERIIRYIEAHRAEQPSLDELARAAGLSVPHLHRLFTRWAGVTPKAYLKHLTGEHAKRLLGARRDVLGAALEAGLSGPGRLHDLLVSVEGATPGELRSRGEGLTIRYGYPSTPFGTAFLAATARGICRLEFVDGPRPRRDALARLRRAWPKARLVESRSAASAAARRVFAPRGRRRTRAWVAGTPFQLQVWKALLRVPRGRAVSYGALAAAVGRPGASRAVGTAVGSNPVACLIPCHRVLRSTGALGGYRWGTERKRALLAWEEAQSSRRPKRPAW